MCPMDMEHYFISLRGVNEGNEEKWDQGMVYMDDVESPVFFIYFLLLQKWPKTLTKGPI